MVVVVVWAVVVEARAVEPALKDVERARGDGWAMDERAEGWEEPDEMRSPMAEREVDEWQAEMRSPTVGCLDEAGDRTRSARRSHLDEAAEAGVTDRRPGERWR